MFWRIHKIIFEDRIQEAQNILAALGDTVQVVEGPLRQLAPVDIGLINEPSLCITTLQDARSLRQQAYPSSPWLFYHPSHYDVSYWSAHLNPQIPWLNRNGIFLPYSHLCHPLLNQLKGQYNKVFIRPDSGNKTFTGFDLKVDADFSEELKKQMLFVRPEPETLCYIAPYQKIDNVEWRFWICEHKIVAYSPYSWEHDPSLSCPPDNILNLATQVAQDKFQPDNAYVADFCQDEYGNAYLIEMNAASTCGIYQVDLNSLLPALRATAHREYQMELD